MSEGFPHEACGEQETGIAHIATKNEANCTNFNGESVSSDAAPQNENRHSDLAMTKKQADSADESSVARYEQTTAQTDGDQTDLKPDTQKPDGRIQNMLSQAQHLWALAHEERAAAAAKYAQADAAWEEAKAEQARTAEALKQANAETELLNEMRQSTDDALRRAREMRDALNQERARTEEIWEEIRQQRILLRGELASMGTALSVKKKEQQGPAENIKHVERDRKCPEQEQCQFVDDGNPRPKNDLATGGHAAKPLVKDMHSLRANGESMYF